MKTSSRRLYALIAALILVVGVGAQLTSGAAGPQEYQCYTAAGVADGRSTTSLITCPTAGDIELAVAANDVTPTTVTTTTTKATTTTKPTTTTVATTTTAPTTTTQPSGSCTGVAMGAGQIDIDSFGTGTTFCISGTHNWSLVPKAGDTFIGGILDGAHSTTHAFSGSAANVTLQNMILRNYNAGEDSGAVEASGASWILRNDDVSGDAYTGISIAGTNWQILGGRYHDNGQEGIEGEGKASNGLVINGAELDHNNFTDSTYTKRKVSCGYEAGGFKDEALNVTVTNSYIHDNACKGVWSDINASGWKITNNTIANNWDDGIFIEISSNMTITGNTVTNNGQRDNSGNLGCSWLWGAGIGLASSDHNLVDHNTLVGNCNGIGLTQQDRSDGKPGLLENDTVSNNSIAGPENGEGTGAAEDNGANLSTRSIVFSNNTFTSGAKFCSLSC